MKIFFAIACYCAVENYFIQMFTFHQIFYLFYKSNIFFYITLSIIHKDELLSIKNLACHKQKLCGNVLNFLKNTFCLIEFRCDSYTTDSKRCWKVTYLYAIATDNFSYFILQDDGNYYFLIQFAIGLLNCIIFGYYPTNYTPFLCV